MRDEASIKAGIEAQELSDRQIGAGVKDERRHRTVSFSLWGWGWCRKGCVSARQRPGIWVRDSQAPGRHRDGWPETQDG